MAARITLASLAARLEAVEAENKALKARKPASAPTAAKAASPFVAARRARALAGIADGSLVQCAHNPKHVMSAARTAIVCKRCWHDGFRK